jgi:hypothetical protein
LEHSDFFITTIKIVIKDSGKLLSKRKMVIKDNVLMDGGRKT